MVGETEGKNLKFKFDETWTGGGSIFQETNKKDLTEISLCSTTIDNILLDAGGNGDSLLFKMDIEGSEGAAMEGFRRMQDFRKEIQSPYRFLHVSI